ncbi:MAG: PAS domain S-box protein, partial [Halobacteriota archaeon]
MAQTTPTTILLIEDSPSDARLVEELLRSAPAGSFNLITVSTLAEGLSRLAANHIDVILLDLSLPDSEERDTFRAVEERAPDLPIIIMTVSTDETLGLEAIRGGAQRFLSKDALTRDGAYAEMFPHVIHYAIEHKKVEAELQQANEEVQKLNEKLRVSNEALEQRVQKRTAELASTASSLKKEVTVRQQAEEQVRAASLYTRSLIEASLDPLVTISAEGLITDVNKATEEATGCSRYELTGSDFSDYFTEPEKARAGSKKVFTDGFVRDYPLTLRHKSGSVIDVLYNATVYRNEVGDVQGVFAAARDITDRKRAEEELQRYSDHLEDLVEERTAQLAQSEEEFRTLFDASGIAQTRYDASGHPMRINKAAADLLGVSTVTDIKHLSLWSSPRIPEESKAQLRAGHAAQFELVYDFRAIREGSIWQSTRSDVRYIDFYLLPLFGTSGNDVEGYLGQLVDITERKQAEAALQASEEQYRTLVETANSVIMAMKTDRTITFINDYGARFFGYAPDELIGKDVMIIVPEVDSTGRPLAPHVGDILARPDEYATNLNENITKDGRRVWVQWVNRGLVDHDGRHIGHLAVGIDVTALKHAEAALKEAERLGAIGQTATMIGHDLRNPLQALQFSLELERKYVETALQAARADPTVEKTVEKAVRLYVDMEQQIRYMDKIVSDLQDYSRPLTLQLEKVRLGVFVADTLALLTIPESVSVNVHITDSLTATIDPHLMQRVLSNLIMNAVQAMPQGGELTIETTAEDHAVVLRIHDTGEGVPGNMRDTLFSPLTTGKAKGTGLG